MNATTKSSPPPYRRGGGWFDALASTYQSLIGEDVAIIVPLREPQSHSLSVAHYFGDAISNSMAKDFRMYNKRDVRNFMQTWLPPTAADSTLLEVGGMHVLLLDRIHESLTLLRHRLNWKLQDTVYVTVLHPTDQARAATSDAHGKHLTSLNLELDMALYNASTLHLERQLSHLRLSGVDVGRETLILERMSQAMTRFCACPKGSLPTEMERVWCQYGRSSDQEKDAERMATEQSA
jgi:hypothetical protein